MSNPPAYCHPDLPPYALVQEATIPLLSNPESSSITGMLRIHTHTVTPTHVSGILQFRSDKSIPIHSIYLYIESPSPSPASSSSKNFLSKAIDMFSSSTAILPPKKIKRMGTPTIVPKQSVPDIVEKDTTYDVPFVLEIPPEVNQVQEWGVRAGVKCVKENQVRVLCAAYERIDSLFR